MEGVPIGVEQFGLGQCRAVAVHAARDQQMAVGQPGGGMVAAGEQAEFAQVVEGRGVRVEDLRRGHWRTPGADAARISTRPSASRLAVWWVRGLAKPVSSIRTCPLVGS